MEWLSFYSIENEFDANFAIEYNSNSESGDKRLRLLVLYGIIDYLT